MGAAYQKAMILYAHRRYADAEVEFVNALAEDPRNGMALAHLALCVSMQRKYQRAAEVADSAIEAAPESSFPHYVAVTIHCDFGNLPRAKRSILEALRQSPLNPDYLALLASMERRLRDTRAALRQAEEGLRILPTHKNCGIVRAEALVDLGRSAEAAESLSTLLADDPESPNTHAARGWALLAASRPREALEHFREALRLDPNFAFAREGYCDAIKCHNRLYRAADQALRRAPRHPGASFWMLVTGMLCILLAAYTGDHDGVRGTSLELRLACAAAAVLLWSPVVVGLISEALLRVHPVLRYTMTLQQRIGADAVFVMIIAVALGILTGWLTGKLWLATLVTDVALLGIPLVRRLEVPPTSTPPPDRGQWNAVLWGHFLAAVLATGVANDSSIIALGIAGFLTMMLATIGFLVAIDVRGLN